MSWGACMTISNHSMTGDPPLQSVMEGIKTNMTTDLEEAGARYAEAKRAWSEVFLFHYNAPSKRPRTVAEAQAMADQEVNLTKAIVDWEIAKINASQP